MKITEISELIKNEDINQTYFLGYVNTGLEELKLLKEDPDYKMGEGTKKVIKLIAEELLEISGNVPYDGLRIVGKDTAVSTGIFLDGVPLDPVCDAGIIFRLNERNQIKFNMMGIKYRWGDGRWHRKLIKVPFQGEIEGINSKLFVTNQDLEKMKKLDRHNKLYEKSFGIPKKR